MSGTSARDVIVIGAGIGGLAAAAYLARGGLSVVVLEARNRIGGLCTTAPFGEGFSAPLVAHALYALDPRVVKELKLAKKGLRFAVRDMPLVGLRPDGRHVVLARDAHRHGARAGVAFEGRRRSLAAHRRRGPGARARPARAVVGRGRRARGAGRSSGTVSPHGRRGLARRRVRIRRAQGHASLRCDGGRPVAARTRFGADACCGARRRRCAVCRARLQCPRAVLARSLRRSPLPPRMPAPKSAPARAWRTSLQASTPSTGVELASGETVAAPRVLSVCRAPRDLVRTPADAADAGFGQAMACGCARPRVGAAKIVLALDVLPAFGGIAVPAGARFVLADRLDRARRRPCRRRNGPARRTIRRSRSRVPTAGEADAGAARPASALRA